MQSTLVGTTVELLLRLAEVFELTPVEEDAAALRALIDGDSVTFVLTHRSPALGTLEIHPERVRTPSKGVGWLRK